MPFTTNNRWQGVATVIFAVLLIKPPLQSPAQENEQSGNRGTGSLATGIVTTPTFAAVSGSLQDDRYVDSFLEGGIGVLGVKHYVRLAGWRGQPSKRHINDRFADYSPFFRDSAQGGTDHDAEEGLESSTVLFYAGDGSPKELTAGRRGKPVQLSEMSLGDGPVRYLLLLACGIMAHGPCLRIERESGPVSDYLAPYRSSQGPACDGVDESYENAFARWASPADRKPALHPNLRLACGGSTALGNLSNPSASFWRLKLLEQLSIADSFLVGYGQGMHVPLCLTRGGAEVQKTALFDREFRVEENEAGDYVYMTYPVVPVQDVAIELGPLKYAAFRHTPTEESGLSRFVPELEMRPMGARSRLLKKAMLSSLPQPLPYGQLHLQRNEIRPTTAIGKMTSESGLDLAEASVSLGWETGVLRLRYDAKGPGYAGAVDKLAENVLSLGHQLEEDDGLGYTFSQAERPTLIRIDRVRSTKIESPALETECFLSCLYLQLMVEARHGGESLSVNAPNGNWTQRVCDPSLLNQETLTRIGFDREAITDSAGKACTPVGSEGEVRQLPLFELRAGGPRLLAEAAELAAKAAWPRISETKTKTENYDPQSFRSQLVYITGDESCPRQRLLPHYRITFFPRKEVGAALPISVDVLALKFPTAADSDVECADT